MRYCCFAVRDTCSENFHLPMFFVNRASAVRALSDVVNKPSPDNAYYNHPEHYQLYEIGSFEDEFGTFTPMTPTFVVDCQSLVQSAT